MKEGREKERKKNTHKHNMCPIRDGYNYRLSYTGAYQVYSGGIFTYTLTNKKINKNKTLGGDFLFSLSFFPPSHLITYSWNFVSLFRSFFLLESNKNRYVDAIHTCPYNRKKRVTIEK